MSSLYELYMKLPYVQDVEGKFVLCVTIIEWTLGHGTMLALEQVYIPPPPLNTQLLFSKQVPFCLVVYLFTFYCEKFHTFITVERIVQGLRYTPYTHQYSRIGHICFIYIFH